MYERVIPRDLFNESMLLKCLGRLVILNESQKRPLEIDFDGGSFDIFQDVDGNISVTNFVVVNQAGSELYLYTPLNARRNYPLMCVKDDEYLEVFDEKGNFTDEFQIGGFYG